MAGTNPRTRDGPAGDLARTQMERPSWTVDPGAYVVSPRGATNQPEQLTQCQAEGQDRGKRANGGVQVWAARRLSARESVLPHQD